MIDMPTRPHTAGTIHHHRPVLPVVNLLVAVAAVSVAAVAIATDDTTSITPQASPRVAAAAVGAPRPWWTDPAQHPANQDPIESSDGAGGAAIIDATARSMGRTGDARAPWWAHRR